MQHNEDIHPDRISHPGRVQAVTEDGVSFTRLVEDDSPQLAELEMRCFTLPWREEQYRTAFPRRFFHAYGLKRNTTILAYVSLYAIAGSLEILNVATHPDHRRHGYAHAVLSRVLKMARRMDMDDAVLEVRHLNQPAIALYEGLGFVRTGIRKGYYPDTGEDGLVYTLNIKEYDKHSL